MPSALRAARDVLPRAALGSTAVARELADLDARLRRPVSTSRRVAVVQSGGGVGGTTLVARVARAAAVRRHGGVLAVDASNGHADLAAATGVTTPLDLARAATLAGITTAAQARDAVPAPAGGPAVLGAGAAPGSGPATVPAWRSALAPVGRFFDLVVTDWGPRDPTDVAALADDHHVVAVVARADRGPAEAALGLLAAALPRTAVVLVLVDVGGTAGPVGAVLERQLRTVTRTTPAPREHLGVPVLPVLTVPHDPGAGPGGPRRPAAAAPLAVRTAWLRVAAALLDAAGTVP